MHKSAPVRSKIVLFILAAVTTLCSGIFVSAQMDPNTFGEMKWRMIGPFRGGRCNGVSGVPGQPNTFYFGSVGGGVWKTENSGRTWNPVFDDQGIASIGAIGVAYSQPNTVYVGTGEADMREQVSYGDGMYKTTDGGKTWTHIGLENTRQIGRVTVDPRNPNIVFVAALGHMYGPNPDRGIFRSKDGGKTWEKVLYKNENVGAIDVAIDPTNSQIVYATLWSTRRPPWTIYPPSNGPGGGIFKSTDGGTTWKQSDAGIPTEGQGRIGITISPTNPKRMYAIVDAKAGGLYRSEDAGATWTLMSNQQRLWGRGWYFCKVVVDPKNPDVVYVSNTSVYKSTDGGKTWTAIKGAPGGDDYHQLWIYPDDPNRMILASDQGTVVSEDGAKTWSSWYNQPIAEMYNVATDYRYPYWATGAQQDSGAAAVSSRSNFAEISNRDWFPLCAGGESGYTAPDPLHPNIVFGGTVSKCNVTTGQTWNVSPERGMPPNTARHSWTLPLVFSEADPSALYFSNQFLYKTTNGGESWTQISQDMTREDPGVPPNLDEATAKDAPEGKRRGVIYSIAPSPLRASTVWIGTDDGLIHKTDDDGKTWTNVTPPDVTPWSKVVMLIASHYDVNSAYATIDRHWLEDNEPYIYRTRDGGKTWQRITNGLPRGVYMQNVTEDPQRNGLLFAGSELSVYTSFDDGDHWQSLQLNLPHVSMRDLQVKDNDLVVATHGRGFWILDDITPLRQVTADVFKSDAYLYEPETAYNLPPPSENGTPQPRDEPLTENQPYGAIIDYYINRAGGSVTLEVLNPAGEVIRKYSSEDKPAVVNPDTLDIPASWRPPTPVLAATKGMHRWIWDLRPQPQAPQGGAGGSGGGGFRGRGAVTLPGTYTVRLTAGGKSYTRQLILRRDPRVDSLEAFRRERDQGEKKAVKATAAKKRQR